MAESVHVALWVRLEAKPGKEKAVADFLRSGLPLVEQEPATIAWFGIQMGPSLFGIFDAFPNDAGRQAHHLLPSQTMTAASVFHGVCGIFLISCPSLSLPLIGPLS